MSTETEWINGMQCVTNFSILFSEAILSKPWNYIDN